MGLFQGTTGDEVPVDDLLAEVRVIAELNQMIRVVLAQCGRASPGPSA